MASAQLRAFALLGDSNINRHINKTSVRSHPSLKSAQIIPCGHLGIFSESLSKLKPDITVCIVSCVSNFLTGAEGPSTISHRVDPVMQQIKNILVESCASFPERLYLISPPMYRTSPTWYREGLPEILTLFSSSMILDRPDNLHLLPSFATPDYEADGIHLTAYSALEFVLHLFDSANDLITVLEAPLEVVAQRSCESTRVLEDRVMALEQDHRRLNRVVESKSAVDHELDDFHKNERFEDSFVIHGLSRISSELVGKPWQEQALRDVQAVLLILLGREPPIVVVQNATSRVPNSEVKYNVKMAQLADAKLIRTKFGSFFLGSKDARPDALRHINIKNRVTPETKTRVEVLKLLASRYRDANPEGKAHVIHHESRPLIKIFPPPKASDRRIRTFNYVEAVKNLPCNFTSAEVTPILKRINPELVGQVCCLNHISLQLFKSVFFSFVISVIAGIKSQLESGK